MQLQVSVPRRMRSGASGRPGDFAAAAAEALPRSPLQRNNRSLGSSGPADAFADRAGPGVRAAPDAAGGGNSRRRGAQSRGGSRNGSPMQLRCACAHVSQAVRDVHVHE